jgi:hypothetical protein
MVRQGSPKVLPYRPIKRRSQMRYLVLCDNYGIEAVVGTYADIASSIEAIRTDAEENLNGIEELDDMCFYVAYEVGASFRYVPPQDKGSLVPVKD